jgi:hypothetical protein
MSDDWDPFADPAELAEVAEPKHVTVRQNAGELDFGTSKEREPETHGDRLLEEPAFEYIETAFGKVGALVHRRRGGAPSATPDYAVVLSPGNPGVIECEVGKYHSHTPGLLAIGDVLKSTGVPFIQFDFAGVGLSAPDGPFQGTWRVEGGDDPEYNYQSRGINEVVAWARANLCNRIVLCCWNWSGYAARELITSDSSLAGFVSVSMPYNIIMLALRQGDQVSHDRMKAHFENFIPNTLCKALYVCGNQDAMCPVNQMKRLNKTRTAGDVVIHEINQKGEGRSSNDNFNMVGHEGEVADAIFSWMKKHNMAASEELVDESAMGA